MRSADVFLFERLVGRLVETAEGRCQFSYDDGYMKEPGAEPVSPTMPFRDEPYWSDEMLPFFDGRHAETACNNPLAMFCAEA